MAEGDLDSALAAARRGRESGFAQLWRTFQPAVLRYLSCIFGAIAEEAASEAWLQVAKDIRSYRGDVTQFQVWLFRMARDRATTLQTLRQQSGHNAAQPLAVEAAGTELAYADTERALGLIARLPKDQAEAVLLRVVAGFDVMEAAQVLGQVDDTVRLAVLSGFNELARILGEEGRATADSWCCDTPRTARGANHG